MAAAWEWWTGLNPTVAAAIVAAVVSVLTVVIGAVIAPPLKFFLDDHLDERKLSRVYKFEQRKALKDRLATHQGLFLEAAESLQQRMWNYERNVGRGWLTAGGKYFGDIRYYPKTFAYRFLLCLGAARLLERQAMYFDATVADKKDFDFLKALKLNLFVWTDISLFDGLDYDPNRAKDHFFRDDLTSMADRFFIDDHVMTLEEFSSAVRKRKHPYVDVFRFFDGLGEPEVRFRHDRVVAAHLTLIATLNSHGYDFHETSVDGIRAVIDHVRNPDVLSRLAFIIKRLKLENDPSFQVLIQEIERRVSLAG